MVAVAVLIVFALLILIVEKRYRGREVDVFTDFDKQKIALIRREVEILESDKNLGKISANEYLNRLKQLSDELERIEEKCEQ